MFDTATALLGGYSIRLHNLAFFRSRQDIVLSGKSSIRIHPATSLIMKDSKLLVESGILRIGVECPAIDYRYLGGFCYDLTKDNTRIHLYNSILHVIGNVSLYPGCMILATDGRIVIRNGTVINAPTYIFAAKAIEIGEFCLLARGITIMDSDFHKLGSGGDTPVKAIKEVKIGDRCWIGQNAMILKGVTVGAGSVVAAGSVVTRDVKPRTLVAGNPARLIRENIAWEI